MTDALRAIRVVVFDLDGTLIDSRGDIVASCNAMLRKAGREELPESVISGFVGDGARLLVERALDLPTEDPEIDRQLEVFLTHYEAHPVDRTTIFPGALAAFEATRPRHLALCTNKPKRTTLPILRAFGWEDTFDVVMGGGDTKHKKPHPEPLLQIAERLSVSPRELLMVGDGPQDIEAGRAAGALTAGVRGGILPEERLLASRPDLLLNDLDELAVLLREYR